MKYFNGFSLCGEELFFTPYLKHSDYTVVGFSYGAQVAFESVYNSYNRVDKIVLLSPAFFQNEKKSFKRAQLHYFERDKDTYLQNFLNNISYPANINLSSHLCSGKLEELDLLLGYRWDRKKIEELTSRGIQIEVYLGGEDRIIDSNQAFNFFSETVETYLIKGAGHLLLPS